MNNNGQFLTIGSGSDIRRGPTQLCDIFIRWVVFVVVWFFFSFFFKELHVPR